MSDKIYMTLELTRAETDVLSLLVNSGGCKLPELRAIEEAICAADGGKSNDRQFDAWNAHGMPRLDDIKDFVDAAEALR